MRHEEFVPHLFSHLVSLWLEKRIDKGRNGGGLGEDQEHPHQEQENQNRQQPPLLAHPQELPELQHYSDFTHLSCLAGVQSTRT